MRKGKLSTTCGGCDCAPYPRSVSGTRNSSSTTAMVASAQRAHRVRGTGRSAASSSLGRREIPFLPTWDGGYPTGPEVGSNLYQPLQGWACPSLRKSGYRKDHLPSDSWYGLGEKAQSQGSYHVLDGLWDQWIGALVQASAGGRHHAFGSGREDF